MSLPSRRTLSGRISKPRKASRPSKTSLRSIFDLDDDSPPQTPATQTPATTSTATSVPRYPRLQIAFDLGTTSNSACFRVQREPQDPYAIIYEVRAVGESWPRDPFSFPSLFWWDKAGKFYTGYELESMILRTSVPREQVISLAKIALYDGPETCAIKAEVQSQLAAFGKTEDQLWQACLTSLVKQALAYIQDGIMYHGIYDTQELENMPREFFFTAPHGMDGKSTQPLTKAAQSLKAEVSVIVSEPLSLSTGLFHELVHVPKHTSDSRQTMDLRKTALDAAREGQITLFVDVGGGYGVTTAVRYVHASTDKLQMEVVVPPETFPCGSMMMNRTFRHWLKTCPQLVEQFGSLKKPCDQLGCSEMQLLANGEYLFEAVKRSLVDGRQTYFMVFESHIASHQPSWVLSMTRRQVEDQMMPTINLVSKLINRTVDKFPLDQDDGVSIPSTIILSGGASKSQLLYDTIRATHGTASTAVRSWEPSTMPCPIPRGALLRRDNTLVRDLASTYNLAILRDEPLDTSDANHKHAFKRVKGKVIADGLFTTPGDYDKSEAWVNDCLIWLLQNEKELDAVPSDHFPAIGEAFEFSQDIVYSRSADFRDGEPLWETDKSDYTIEEVPSQIASNPTGLVKLRQGCIMRKGLNYFACQKWTIPATRLRKFGAYTHRDGSQTHAIRIQTRVVLGDGTIDIAFKAVDRVGKAGRGVMDDGVVDASLDKEPWDRYSIWSAKHSQIPSKADDTLGI